MNPTFTITVMAGFDGGRIVYEAVQDDYGAHESRLVFGGNPDEVSKLDDASLPQKEEPRQIEAPAKIRVRRKSDTMQHSDHLSVLEALATVEDAG